MNNNISEPQTLIVGLWKFDSQAVSRTVLIELAAEWAKEPEYLQLYIRKASTHQTAIGFTYKPSHESDNEAAYTEYFNKTSDYLKRRFGNSLAGWDLACPVWIVK